MKNKARYISYICYSLCSCDVFCSTCCVVYITYSNNHVGILQKALLLGEDCVSICSFCSRMKRGRLYSCARREGYNVLALGQHLDDLAESFLMSAFHNGLLRTMKASYTVE